LTNTPITHNYDENQAIGWVEIRGDKIFFVMNDSAKLTVEAVNTVNKAFVPTYQISKAKDGIVQEVELIAMNLTDSGMLQ
jgi:hypothetical protein